MFHTVETARRIRDARLAQNMTQMALADAMGVSFQAVSNWERGNSMPDIGKLSQLCAVLNISLSDLLGNEQPETEIVEKMMQEKPVTVSEIAKVAPLASPGEMEKAVQHAEENEQALDIQDILSLAPFLDSEYLSRLAEKAADISLDNLIDLAPFLSRETLDKLIDRCDETNEDIVMSLAPFLSRKRLDQLAEHYEAEDFSRLSDLAPFLSEDTLSRIVGNMLEKGSFSTDQFIPFAPFLSKETLRVLTDKLMNKR